MAVPDPAKVDEYMRIAEKQLRNIDFHRGDVVERATAARVWMDMARLQYERVRDHRAALLNNPKEN